MSSTDTSTHSGDDGVSGRGGGGGGSDGGGGGRGRGGGGRVGGGLSKHSSPPQRSD